MFWSKEIDPVCKMKVDKNVPNTSTHHGRTYYFCAANCKHTFDKDPAKYAKN